MGKFKGIKHFSRVAGLSLAVLMTASHPLVAESADRSQGRDIDWLTTKHLVEVPNPAPAMCAGHGCEGGAVCGNSILDPGEQCDDGNATPGDGCSETCQVESGYQCTAPVPPDLTNLVQDPGFEGGPGGGAWEEFSFNFGTPICDETECGVAGQRSGMFWVWFGGINGTTEEAHVAQTLMLPMTATEARFWLRAPACDMPEGYVELLVDDNQVWVLFADDPACFGASYQEFSVDISAFADGGMHEIKFHSETFDIDLEGFTDFYLDDVSIPQGPLLPIPSDCELIEGFIFGNGFESS
jgi:cysteine-rich repeat protein